MTVVTVSRGSYSMGKVVAEQLAKRLGFESLSRDVLLEASGKYDIPEIKLVNAFVDAPSILDRFTHGRQEYIAYIQSALTRHLCRDDVIYHGLGGHVLLKNVPHVLKVCIIADLEKRLENLMEREHVTEPEAIAWITKVDDERRRWTQQLYGVDPWDPILYDAVIKIGRFEVEEAVDAIFQFARMPRFKTTPDSKRAMEDLALACEIKAALIAKFPAVKVSCNNGNVVLYAGSGEHAAKKLKTQANTLSTQIADINSIEVHTGASPPPTSV